MVKIFIDAGHGGTDPGAVANGLKEKDLTLKIAKKIRDMLNEYENVSVKLSREGDQTLTLKQRTDAANAWKADYLISVHINAGGGTGFESFTYNGKYSGKQETNRKRTILHTEILQALGSGIRNRGEKEANFHMVRESSMESVLTENLFIDTKADADKLKQDAFLTQVAKGHVNGLVRIFNLSKKAAAKPVTKPEAAAPGKLYKVQVGAFADKKNAEKLADELKKKGYTSYIVQG